MKIKHYFHSCNLIYNDFNNLYNNSLFILNIITWITMFAMISNHFTLDKDIALVILTSINIGIISHLSKHNALKLLLLLFTQLSCWRIAVLLQLPLLPYLYAILFFMSLVELFSILPAYLKPLNMTAAANSKILQLFSLRLLVSLIFIPHFCEKLFAGSSVRLDDIHSFIQLGVPHAQVFVIFAGIIELLGSFALCIGLLTRPAAIGVAIYLIVASVMGHHFSIGFIWATPGGGWEYPVFWAISIISFACFGAGPVSFDHLLKHHKHLPKYMRYLLH